MSTFTPYQVICLLKAVKQEKQGAFHSQHFNYKTKVQSRIAGKPLRSFKQPLPVSPGDEGKSVSAKRGAWVRPSMDFNSRFSELSYVATLCISELFRIIAAHKCSVVRWLFSPLRAFDIFGLYQTIPHSVLKYSTLSLPLFQLFV